MSPALLHTVFLDRDGVINRKPPEGEYVCRLEQFHLLPGVAEAIARLNGAGLLVLVVSNQRGIARGLYTAADVAAIHHHLLQQLALHGAHVDGFYFCPHDKNQCRCRKPGTGLFEQAQAEFPQVEWTSSLLIGDSKSDIEAGRALGMRTIFLDTGENKAPGTEQAAELADEVFRTLPEAVSAVLTSCSELHAGQDALVRQGMEEMKNGNVVSHAEVKKRLQQKGRAPR
jgi:D-glycero-D-manno-heptose 1,7-bisphosphate phosphatase